MASASTHHGIPLMFRYPGAKGRAIEKYGDTYKEQAEGINHIIVPFAGTLAEPLWLLKEGVFSAGGRLTVNDASPHVINLWRAVVTDSALLTDLATNLFAEWNTLPLDRETREAAFLVLRGQVNKTVFGVAPTAGLYGSTLQAARFLLFQATNFNGLVRVNGSGRLNVPYGTVHGQQPRALNVEAIGASINRAAELLSRVEVKIACKDWRDVLTFDAIGDGDTLVVADPPYYKTHSSYTADKFPSSDHVDLVQALTDAPCRAIVTNSTAARTLFDPDLWDVSDHEVRRSIAPTAEGRGNAGEILAVKRVAR